MAEDRICSGCRQPLDPSEAYIKFECTNSSQCHEFFCHHNGPS